MTKQESINRFITEKVFGECWHEWKYNVQGTAFTAWPCICGRNHAEISNPNYCGSWEESGKAFGLLWEKMRDDYNTIDQLIVWEAQGYRNRADTIRAFIRLINPARFAEAVARFYGWKEK